MYVSILPVISINESSLLSTYEYLSWKIFLGLKIILWTLSRYFSCFMWNMEMGRTSGRRAARFFCKTIVCGKMTAFWVVEPRRWRLRLIFWTISRVFSRRCPPNNHFTTTANRNGRSIWVSGYCRYWPFVCYSWGYFTHCSEKKQAEGVGSAEDQLHDVYLMLKHHLFNSFLSSG